jgi:hypothetical protein
MKSIDKLKNTYRAFLMPASLVAASKKDQNEPGWAGGVG